MVPDEYKACVGHGVLLLPGRRPVGDGRRGARRAGQATSSRQLGLVDAEKVERGYVTRVPLAYPMYDADYAERVDAIRAWLETLGNLQQVGRNGLHRYNNSDHSMLTAIRAVENVVDGTDHDLWAVNAESVYHETDERGRAALPPRARDAGRCASRWSARARLSRNGLDLTSSGRLSDGWTADPVERCLPSGGRLGPGSRPASRKRTRKDSLKGGGRPGGSRRRPSPFKGRGGSAQPDRRRGGA